MTVPGYPGGLPGLGENGGDDWRRTLRSRLFERRVVVVSGQLDDAAAGQVAAELMTLDADGDEPIHLQLSGATGVLDAALSLMDVVELVGVPVRATCTGLVGGPVVGVLAVCSHRAATAHTRFHLTEPPRLFAGPARDIERWAGEQAARFRLFSERLAEAVHRRPDDVAADLENGRYLGAEEAMAYGLLDEIRRPDAELYRLPSHPIGFRPPR